MFYKREKSNKNSNAKLSKRYETIHARNRSWMDQAGKQESFTAYNSIKHKAVRVAHSKSGRGSDNTFVKINDFKTSINDAKSEIRSNINATKDSFTGSFKMLKDSLRDSIKTGRLYSKEREEEASRQGMKSFGLDMDVFDVINDFDFGEDDMSDDIFTIEDGSEETEEKPKKRKRIINNTTNFINKSGLSMKEAEILSTSVVSATNSIIKVNMAGFLKISDTYKYMNEVSNQGYSNIVSQLGSLSNTIDDILNKKAITTVHGSKSMTSLSDLTKINFVTVKGFKGFIDGIKDATGLIKMLSGPMLYAAAANPVYSGLKMLMSDSIKKSKLGRKAKRLDDRLSNLPMDLYMTLRDGGSLEDVIGDNKIGRYMKKKGIFDKINNGKLGKFLNNKLFKNSTLSEMLKNFNTSAKLDKGTAVAFDAETHNTINTVIPGYLGKLYSTLTGKKIYNDYDSGYWHDSSSSKVNIEKKRTDFINNNHHEFKKLFADKFGKNSDNRDLIKRVIDDKILSLDDLKSKEDNYTKEEFEKLKQMIDEDIETFRLGVRKGSLISSAYYKNSSLSASEKNLYNNLFKDDDNIYKTGEEKALRKLKGKLIYSGKLMKNKIKELEETQKALSKAQEELAEKEALLEEKSSAETSSTEEKAEPKKTEKEEKKEKSSAEKSDKDAKKVEKENDKKAKEDSKELTDESKEDSSVLDDIKDGYNKFKGSKWSKRLANSKLGRGLSKLKDKFSGKGKLGKIGRLFGRVSSKFGKLSGKFGGKLGLASNLYDVLNGDADIVDMADMGMDAYDALKGKGLKGKAGELASKGKEVVSTAKSNGGFFSKAKDLLSKAGAKTGSLIGAGASKIGKTLSGLGKGLFKGGLRAGLRSGLKFAGPIGWGASLLLAGPEIMETIKNPLKSLSDPLGTLGSLFGFNDHPSKRDPESESITSKVLTAPLKWLGIMKDGDSKPNIAKAADEAEGNNIFHQGMMPPQNKATSSNGTFGSLGISSSEGMSLMGTLGSLINSTKGKDILGGKDGEDEKGKSKFTKIMEMIWKFTPMGILGIKLPFFNSESSAKSSAVDEAELFNRDEWMESFAESTGEYGNKADGYSKGDLSEEMGTQKVDTVSQAVMTDPGLVVNNLLMMSPLGMFMGLGKQKTDSIFKSNTMKLAEKDPKQFARVMFANTTIGSVYNLAEPSNLALSALSTGMLNIFAPLDDFTDNQDIMRDTTNFQGEKGTTLTIRDALGDTKSSGGSSSSGSSSSGGSSTASPSTSSTGEAKSNVSVTGSSTTPSGSSKAQTSSGSYTGEKYERPPLPDFEKKANNIIGNDIAKMDKLAKKIYELQNRPDPRKDHIVKAVKDLTKKMIEESKAHADPLTGYDHDAYLILRDILEVVENIGTNVMNINKNFDTVTTKLKNKTTKIVKNNSIRKTINITIEDKIKEQAVNA